MQMVNADKTSTVRKSGFIFKFENHSFMTRQQGKKQVHLNLRARTCRDRHDSLSGDDSAGTVEPLNLRLRYWLSAVSKDESTNPVI